MSPFRRTPIRLLIVGFVFFTLLWAFDISWELPESWKETGIMASSREKISQVFSNKKNARVDEIYGLLRLVTADSGETQHVLSNDASLDPTKPINLQIYAAGNKWVDWQAEVERINKEYPVVVFSKSYCPHSKDAKNLLAGYDLQPLPKIIEVDLRDDSTIIKALLTRLTNHSTFPNIVIRGKSLGGADDLRALHATKSLAEILKKAGVSVHAADVE